MHPVSVGHPIGISTSSSLSSNEAVPVSIAPKVLLSQAQLEKNNLLSPEHLIHFLHNQQPDSEIQEQKEPLDVFRLTSSSNDSESHLKLPMSDGPPSTSAQQMVLAFKEEGNQYLKSGDIEKGVCLYKPNYFQSLASLNTFRLLILFFSD